MKFSELWLREWVNPAIDSNSLVENITMSGLEVKSIEPVSGNFNGVVVGKVIQCQQHPNAPKFCITQVDIGEKNLLDIVCGAPNCRPNLCVAVAIIGALLPGYLKIKATKLFGKLSEGILCSFSELGISEYYSGSGIIELPTDAPVGRDIREYLQLNDNMIDINVTPNRADCLCLLGIARDVAVCHRMDLNIPVIEPVVPLVNDTLPIQVNAQEACPCYFTRVITNINIGATTPLWMKEKLRRCGLRLVDTVVDITNYVLLELGQPMHVFDLDRIDSCILVRQARQDETMTLLDGSGEITLSSDTLVIADKSKVLAIAGILDGAASSISASTSNIILTCAYFNPLAINGSTRRYGLHTDASHRYERGVDSALQNKAMERATVLLMTICGGKPGPVINLTTASNLKQPVTIELRRKTMDRLIGYPISDHEVNDILIRLGCQVSSTKEGWHTLTPSWRFDMAIEEDLIEEVARVYGYEAIPNIPIRTNLEMQHHREAALTLARVKMLLVDRGYQEAITYSFVDPKMQALLYPNTTPLLLPRPISQKMSAMRLSLWVGLLEAVVYNQNRQQHRIRLFESGLRFMPDNSANLGIRQDLMLAGVITGLLFNEHWDLVRRPVDFYDVKGDLEAIFELTGKLDNIEFKAQHNLALHPGQSAAIYLKDELIGFLGLINPIIESKLNLNGRTLVFELLWEKVSERKIPKANKISCFPANRRDIAVVVAANIAAADIIKECKRVVANQLVEIHLFDVYQGKGVAEGFKSIAISLILQDTTCTLKEEDIAAIVAKCVAALKQRFQAFLRDESYSAY